MKIYTAGLPVKYVDEAPPVLLGAPNVASISVEDAIRLAQARAGVPVVQEGQPVVTEEKQVLKFTREHSEESPLIDNSKAVIDPGVNPSAFLENPQAPVVEATKPEVAAVVPATRVEEIVADVTATAVKLDEVLTNADELLK